MEWGYSVDIDPLETLKIRYAMVLRDNKKLQTEVEQLNSLVDAILDGSMKTINNLKNENAKLRKVVDAARELPSPAWEHSNPVEDKLWDVFITALAELDKEGER